jgi:hypothetical protein
MGELPTELECRRPVHERDPSYGRLALLMGTNENYTDRPEPVVNRLQRTAGGRVMKRAVRLRLQPQMAKL